MRSFIAGVVIACSCICVGVCVWPKADGRNPGGRADGENAGARREGNLVNRGISPGQPAPLWTLPKLDGGTASLASFRGDYVVQAFWATWCVPARSTVEGMMSLLHSVYGDDNGVKIVSIGISVWTDLESMEKERVFTRELGCRWTRVYDEKAEASTRYQIECIPTITLIDPDGNMVMQGEAWEVLTAVREVLAKKVATVKIDEPTAAYLAMGEGYAVAGDEYFTNQTKNRAAIRCASDFLQRYGERATAKQLVMARQFLSVLLSCSGDAIEALGLCNSALQQAELTPEARTRLLYARAHALGHLHDTGVYLACLNELKKLNRFFAERVGWELWRIYDVNVAVAHRAIPEEEKPTEAWRELEGQYLLIADIFPAWPGAHYHLAHFYHRCADVQSDRSQAESLRWQAGVSLAEGVRLSWDSIWEFPRQVPPKLIVLEKDDRGIRAGSPW